MTVPNKPISIHYKFAKKQYSVNNSTISERIQVVQTKLSVVSSKLTVAPSINKKLISKLSIMQITIRPTPRKQYSVNSCIIMEKIITDISKLSIESNNQTIVFPLIKKREISSLRTVQITIKPLPKKQYSVNSCTVKERILA